MGKPPSEPTITVDDLRHKWDDLRESVASRTRARVLGVSALTLGGLTLGVTALGFAFWLGRRSAARPVPHSEPVPGPSQVPQSARLGQILQPALEAAARSAVAALAHKLTAASSERR